MMATVNGLTVMIRMTRMAGMTGRQVWLNGITEMNRITAMIKTTKLTGMTRMPTVNGLTVMIRTTRMAGMTGITRITRMKRDKSLG